MCNHVLLGLEQDNVYLGGKQTAQDHETTQANGDAHRSCLHSVVTGCHVKYREERQPDDAGGIHGEAYELGFIEVFRTLPCFEGIHSA